MDVQSAAYMFSSAVLFLGFVLIVVELGKQNMRLQFAQLSAHNEHQLARIRIENKRAHELLERRARAARRVTPKGSRLATGWMNGESTLVFPPGKVELIDTDSGKALRFVGDFDLAPGQMVEVRTI